MTNEEAIQNTLIIELSDLVTPFCNTSIQVAIFDSQWDYIKEIQTNGFSDINRYDFKGLLLTELGFLSADGYYATHDTQWHVRDDLTHEFRTTGTIKFKELKP